MDEGVEKPLDGAPAGVLLCSAPAANVAGCCHPQAPLHLGSTSTATVNILTTKELKTDGVLRRRLQAATERRMLDAHMPQVTLNAPIPAARVEATRQQGGAAAFRDQLPTATACEHSGELQSCSVEASLLC